MVTPVAKREAVGHLRSAFEVSERRACTVIEADRTSVRYRVRRADDEPIRVRLRELASQRRRFGYRRLHVLLTREGLIMNHKKLRRLYREERLQVRRRFCRKRAVGTRAPIAVPQGANQRWSLDFASDALSDGRRFRILTIVDDFTRECLALIADTSLSGLRVVRELDALIAVRGCPTMCVSDNGTELTSMAVLRWWRENRVEWHYIAPGKPQQNALRSPSSAGCATSSSTRRCSARSAMRARLWRCGRSTPTLSDPTAGPAISRPSSMPSSVLP